MFLNRQELERKLGRKPVVGITFSTFDLFHSGHVLMVQEAREQCDWLIVGLLTDPTIDRPGKNKPVQTASERYLQVSACKYVDEVIPFEHEAEIEELVRAVSPDVRVIGEEYQDEPKHLTDHSLCKVYYNKRRHNWSTTELRKRIYEAEKKVEK